jgi:thiol-disulfide isomerase/thioredoxin
MRALALFAAVAVASAMGGAAYHLWSRSGTTVVDRTLSPQAIVERVYAAQLADLNGASQGLGQWRGQVLVINFWATWCAPCREEIPGFVNLQERYNSRGLRFVGIAIDQPDKVAEFAREFRINYPLLTGGVETLDLLRQAGNRAGVLPYTLIIDRSGNLVGREPGGLKEAKLEGIIQPLL